MCDLCLRLITRSRTAGWGSPTSSKIYHINYYDQIIMIKTTFSTFKWVSSTLFWVTLYKYFYDLHVTTENIPLKMNKSFPILCYWWTSNSKGCKPTDSFLLLYCRSLLKQIKWLSQKNKWSTIDFRWKRNPLNAEINNLTGSVEITPSPPLSR